MALDGFTGFKKATVRELHRGREVMIPFHVVKLGSVALDQGGNGFNTSYVGGAEAKDDALHKCWRSLTTGMTSATEKEKAKLENLLISPEHEPIQLVWGLYQATVDDYQLPEPDVAR